MAGAIALPLEPLRTLYENSALIVVGRPTESSTVKRDQYSRLIKTGVEVSQTLKGAFSKSTIWVYHDELGNPTDPFAGGAPILIFLKHRESKGVFKTSTYEPVDSTFSVKQLTDSELASYTSRIKSLQATLQGERPCRSELGDWLVQTIEDPVTRWEGAVDLQRNGPDPVFQDCGEPQPTAGGNSIDAVTGPGEPRLESGSSGPACSVVRIADMLTQSQKDRIMSVVLGLDKISEGDVILIRVVAGWKDQRMVPFMLSKLEQMTETPNETAAHLALILGELLDDEKITETAGLLQDAAYKAGPAPTPGEEIEDRSSDEPEDNESASVAANQSPNELLRHFISQVKAKVAQEPIPQSASPSASRR